MTPPRPDPVNILLVDDQPAKLLSYEVILGELGETLIKANSAREALGCLLKNDVALVLIDVCMPELDGLGVLEALRKLPNPPRVVGVTMSEVAGVAALQAGAFDILHKPTALATDRLYELGDDLVAKVLLAATASTGCTIRRTMYSERSLQPDTSMQGIAPSSR